MSTGQGQNQGQGQTQGQGQGQTKDPINSRLQALDSVFNPTMAMQQANQFYNQQLMVQGFNPMNQGQQMGYGAGQMTGGYGQGGFGQGGFGQQQPQGFGGGFQATTNVSGGGFGPSTGGSIGTTMGGGYGGPSNPFGGNTGGFGGGMNTKGTDGYGGGLPNTKPAFDDLDDMFGTLSKPNQGGQQQQQQQQGSFGSQGMSNQFSNPQPSTSNYSTNFSLI